jgi:hypothetical protein
MHIVRKLTPRLLFCFFYLIIPCTLFAAERDTSIIAPFDTSKTRAHWLTNRDFNDIYIQNLRPSSAGQEFFDPHKTLLVADVTANFILLNTPKLPFFFAGSARINVRLFAGEGSPVKSPSYMPGGTLYFRLNRQSYNPKFFSVSYTHHSNGQEGPTLNPNGTFNTDSGKFTTNFYTFTYHTGKRTDLADLIITRYDAIGLELHSGIIDEGYIKALKGKYGYARLNGDWLYNIARANKDPIDPDKKVFSNWQRLDFQFAYIADKYDDYNEFDLKKRLNVVLKYYYQFRFMQNVSILVGAGYRGQDEYNIFFQDSYAYAVVGFAAGLSFNMHQK